VQHLLHFCAVLPKAEYSDNRPMFGFQENSAGLIRGEVILPNSVHPNVRRTVGKAWWRTEQAARKEAAFQAYKALYAYGLVNDNLLPLTRKPELRYSEQMNLPSIVDAAEQYDPYVDLAQGRASGQLCQTRLKIYRNGYVDDDMAVSLILPRMTPMPDPIPLYWDPETTLNLTFEPQMSDFVTSMETLEQMERITALYLQAPSSRQLANERDFVALFVPDIPHEQLGQWTAQHEGNEPALEVYSRGQTSPPGGIIRDHSKYSEPRTFIRWIVPAHVSKSSPIEIECSSLPRRRNLLQIRTMAMAEDGELEAPKKSYVIPAAACVVDKLPAKQAAFGLFISAILDRLEASLVAHRLNDTVLKGVGIQNIRHVITAISAPIAQASTNYQRFEFFGDSVLKFTVSCQLFFRNTNWHEGYLSESRDKLIQNARLARAALDTGIDSFILTNRFTPRRWSPPLIRNKLEPSTAKRKLSTKVLADVVESLIGAAYVDGGIRKAQACLHRFLPEIDLFTSEISPTIIPPGKGVSGLINPHRLAGLIGYTFKEPALLTEALTHASCEYDMTTQSYQRLEFLGDAVLDMVVMAVIAAHPVKMDQGPMTLLKHSVVNANLLAFFCMELTAPDEPTYVPKFSRGDIYTVPVYDQIHLWRFLRSHGPSIDAAREACLERHQALRGEIHEALKHGAQYPWELFARLRPDKFLSDIIESVIGAMFIDSGGNLDVCHAFVERIGLVWYIQRAVADGVNVVHPRNIAQDMVKGTGTLVFKRKRIEAKGGVATYRCSAVVNKIEIAAVEGCASAEEAEVKVANAAIGHLTLHPL
jgi:dsRNA-specific ribonuclease